MKKSKADPLKPPIEDLQGQVYQHELGDPDRAKQIDHLLDKWRPEAGAKKRSRQRKETVALPEKTGGVRPFRQPHKHLLIAVDESEVSQRAVAYVAEMISGRKDIRVLLAHAARPAKPRLLEFGGCENPKQEKASEAALRRVRADHMEREDLAAAPMFAHGKEILGAAGVPEQAVDTQTVDWNPNEGLDSAILRLADEKHCGTIVVGYAAFSWFHGLLHAHLADVLLKNAAGVAIWIIH
jgi:nucleotide-binding universal stress UspA family protein